MDAFASGHREFMAEALAEARAALVKGEVPVGAVIVREGKIIARAHNLRESLRDPTAHAEMLVIQQAAKQLRVWRLDGCTLYVTLEPCAMCAGAIVAARIPQCVFGATDPKAGAAGSVFDVLKGDIIQGVCEQECSAVLKQFFQTRRDDQED